MTEVKPFAIEKLLVWQAYKRVKANGGSAGCDDVSFAEFEEDLRRNLYRLWNRLSSVTYFPPPVKAVEIPKTSGGVRVLGIPTVSDRIAQTVVGMVLERHLEPHFDDDSYGYRPRNSAHQALEVVRSRCWQYDWAVEFDIKGMFDNIDHELLLKALARHPIEPWVVLYIRRWIVAPLQLPCGGVKERTKGTPQGGVISPILANLFMHYAFDRWMRREFPSVLFCRYADDGLIHCKSKKQAVFVLARLTERLMEVGLEIHPEKSRLVYCKDKNRKGGELETVSFTFLGYTFQPRRCVNGKGIVHPNFLPAVSRDAKKAMHRKIRSWHMQLANDKEIDDLSRMFNPILHGWKNYYGRFYPSGLKPVWKSINDYLVRWVRRKYRGFARHRTRARSYLRKIAQNNPELFVHWRLGFQP
jgi:RNA-directed DNA polymerase